MKMPEGSHECVLGHIYSAIIQTMGFFPKKTGLIIPHREWFFFSALATITRSCALVSLLLHERSVE